MRVCLVYDCLFPHTVGGAERWYRNLAERLSAAGHDVTYLTLRQWPRGGDPGVTGVRVVTAGPRMKLYVGGRRRILPPLIFGAGVLWHLLRHGARYDVVQTASFPYFSLLAASAVRPLRRFALVVDWHELWTQEYWQEYLGRIGGLVGYWVQRLCVAVPQQAFCFSRLHAGRLREQGLHGPVQVLEGEYSGSPEGLAPVDPEPLIVFAGRHIPEKRVPSLVRAFARVHERLPEVRCEIYGDGPEREMVKRLASELGLEGVVAIPGFVPSEVVESALRRAMCMVLPSRREGYGLIVVESSAGGTPSVVVQGPDNAAVELVEEGVNGFVAATDAPEALAGAILAALEAGSSLRTSTADWYARNAQRLSLSGSLEAVADSYAAKRVLTSKPDAGS